LELDSLWPSFRYERDFKTYVIGVMQQNGFDLKLPLTPSPDLSFEHKEHHGLIHFELKLCYDELQPAFSVLGQTLRDHYLGFEPIYAAIGSIVNAKKIYGERPVKFLVQIITRYKLPIGVCYASKEGWKVIKNPPNSCYK
jgi:hypothetical protein